MTVVSNEMRGFSINLNSFINEDNCKAISGLFGVLLEGIFCVFFVDVVNCEYFGLNLGKINCLCGLDIHGN